MIGMLFGWLIGREIGRKVGTAYGQRACDAAAWRIATELAAQQEQEVKR